MVYLRQFVRLGLQMTEAGEFPVGTETSIPCTLFAALAKELHGSQEFRDALITGLWVTKHHKHAYVSALDQWFGNQPSVHSEFLLLLERRCEPSVLRTIAASLYKNGSDAVREALYLAVRNNHGKLRAEIALSVAQRPSDAREFEILCAMLISDNGCLVEHAHWQFQRNLGGSGLMMILTRLQDPNIDPNLRERLDSYVPASARSSREF